MISCVVFLTVG